MQQSVTRIPLGAVIGILGDGQLAQKIAIAAVRLGYRVAILGPGGRNSPAGYTAFWAEAWGPDCEVSDELLGEFCSLVSVVLIEWENVPVDFVERLERRGTPVRPSSKVLRIAQNRLLEKETAESLNIPVPHYRKIVTRSDDIDPYPATDSEDKILKRLHGGYDGKGQMRIPAGGSIEAAWETLNCAPCILEDMVRFVSEISVIVARSPDMGHSQSQCISYGPFENTHENGILRSTRYPASCIQNGESFFNACSTAINSSHRFAEALDVEGLLVCEYFITEDGNLLFNEMAPRPHNSGHLTIDCCHASQFEQYVRAACRLPWGSLGFHSGGVMQNILGHEIENWPLLLAQNVQLHVYGKEVRDGRKMGHYTRLMPL